MATYPLDVVYCPNCSFPPEFCRYSASFEKCKPWLKDHFPHLYPDLFGSPAAAGDASVASVTEGVAGLSVAAVGGGGASATTPADGAAGAAGDSAAKPADAAEKAVGGAGSGAEAEGEGGDKKKSKRGGQVKPGGGEKKKVKVQPVVISKQTRGKGKFVTTIKGLETFDVKLKDAASAIGKRFGTGASVTKSATGEQEITVQGDLGYDLEEAFPTMFPSVPEDAILVKD